MRTTAAASKRVFAAGQKKVVSSDLGAPRPAVFPGTVEHHVEPAAEGEHRGGTERPQYVP
jgi:hypothetical protein